jgi:hypothetical protein
MGAVVTVANTTAVAFCSSFRIKRIVYWGPVGGAGSSSCFLDAYTGGTSEQALQKDKQVNNILPTGITDETPFVFRPGRDSYLSHWQTANINPSDQLLVFSGGTGGVMDVHVTFTIPTGAQGTYSRTTTSTASVGQVGAFCLDTSNKLAPVGPTNLLN